MRLAEIESLVLLTAGAAALYIFATGGMHDNHLQMAGGLAVYAAVWVYGLVRVSYS